jgi:hypothetical protein
MHARFPAANGEVNHHSILATHAVILLLASNQLKTTLRGKGTGWLFVQRREFRTQGPARKGTGVDACVFGVTGNSPIDYLATLRYVAHRIEPGAHVAFYL